MVPQFEIMLASFSECPIAPLEGTPNHAFLTEMNTYMDMCSSSLHSNLGNGQVGYLVVTAQPAAFALAYPVGFIILVNPIPKVTV